MIKIKKTSIILTISLIISLVGSACGNKDSGVSSNKIVLTYFHYCASDAEPLNNTAKAFNELNKNIEIKNEIIAADYNTVLKTKDAGGKLPDIFAASTAGETALKPYIEAGKLADVSNLKVIKQLPEDFRKSITFSDGKIYLVPVSNSVRGIVYNKDLFKKAGISDIPRTLDSLKDAVDKLNMAGITPFAISGKDGWSLGSNIFQPGQEIMSSKEWLENRWKGQGKFKDNAIPVFDLIDLVKNNCQEKPMDTDYMTTVGMFAEGSAAMLLQGSWIVFEVSKMNPDIMNNCGYFPIPYTNDENKNKLYFDTIAYMVVNSKANIEAVDKYFDFLINGEGKKLFYEETKNLNPYDITFSGGPVFDDIFKYIKSNNIIVNYQYNNMPDGFWQINASAMQEYMAGKVTKEQMLDLLDKSWDDMVKK